MNTDTRQVYLSPRFEPVSAAATVGSFLWRFVKMIPTMANYMLYCLNERVHRGRLGYQHVIHIPVSYENQDACHPA
jgi:hypothetical protein